LGRLLNLSKTTLSTMKKSLLILPTAFLLAGAAFAADAEAAPWWNPAWTQRQTLTLDPAAAETGDSPGTATVLVRLSDANFPFASAREDGSDLRFIAADGKTQLAHQIESYDNLLNEAFVWVKLPDLKNSAKETVHLYSGNPTPDAAPKATDAFDADTALVWHFAGRGTAPADTTANANNATTPATTAEGSLIGNGLRLLATPVTLPESPSLEWKAGQALTIATWIKPAALQDNALLLSRGEGAQSLQILLNQGVPTLKLGGKTSAAAAPVAPAIWSHLALVADGTKLELFLNGASYATLEGALPALTSSITLGAETSGFAGELDEFSLSTTARSAAWIKLNAVNQGSTDAAQRVLSLGAVEGGEAEAHSGMMEHVMLFGDIANNMMFDGWIAIGVCVIMIIVGWTVAVKKFLYLNSIEKGTKIFLQQWKTLSTDLTALDTEDKSSVSSLGGTVHESEQALIQKSPLFHIYQIGADEIRHRLDKDNTRAQGLNGRSIQAIRASLDAGLVHETHRLSDGLVYLTMSIAGGPYVGLLGTVVGVMITFAIIAKSGEVNVNSIAPGIASALLATVVGLVVAIPALFIYSYLNGRIKNSLGLMQVFIDEFVAKMAEFYRPAGESDYTGGSSSH
jgi:biopolymer transport protein ExbB